MPDKKVYSESVRDLPPPTLFKYRTCDAPETPHPERARYQRDHDIIVGNALWAASPLSFNDLFDCVPVIDTSGTEEEMVAYATRVATRQGQRQGLNPTQTRSLIEAMIAGMRKDWAGIINDPVATQIWKDGADKMGVICLSEKPDDMLMWGYYADSHRGYCLEYDTSVQPFMLASRVRYFEDRARFRVLDANRDDLMESTLLVKAKFWEHEYEWRFVRPGKIGAWEYRPELLKSIILGANIPNDHEFALRNMVLEHDGNVAIKRAVPDAGTFKLHVVDA